MGQYKCRQNAQKLLSPTIRVRQELEIGLGGSYPVSEGYAISVSFIVLHRIQSYPVSEGYAISIKALYYYTGYKVTLYQKAMPLSSELYSITPVTLITLHYCTLLTPLHCSEY